MPPFQCDGAEPTKESPARTRERWAPASAASRNPPLAASSAPPIVATWNPHRRPEHVRSARVSLGESAVVAVVVRLEKPVCWSVRPWPEHRISRRSSPRQANLLPDDRVRAAVRCRGSSGACHAPKPFPACQPQRGRLCVLRRRRHAPLCQPLGHAVHLPCRRAHHAPPSSTAPARRGRRACLCVGRHASTGPSNWQARRRTEQVTASGRQVPLSPHRQPARRTAVSLSSMVQA